MPNVYAANKTASSITVSSWTVYDSNETPVDAFQFTLNNTPWWYVLDGVQTAWVDDLSSIGYHITVPVVLPTVTLPNYGWYSSGSTDQGTAITSGSSFMLKNTSGTVLPYDSSCSYAIYYYYPSRVGSGAALYGFTISNDSNQMKATNNSGATVTIQRVIYAACSDSSATVVTVYNSSNVAYNAFKYTANGTDYYYVLDGTQTDWTDDLSSIGYYLPITGYANAQKTRVFVNNNSSTETPLKDENGNNFTYDSTPKNS